jgi:UDP-galactopyranose mutase
MQDLICVSHLRWDFVWQRPQHLMSRMAGEQRVFYIEEPIASEEATEPRLDTYVWTGEDGAQVTVVRLIQPVEQSRWIGHGDLLTANTYQTLVREYLQAQNVRQPIMWMYTPMAFGFVSALRPKFVVYDVMDQLSAFKGAPVELRVHEREMLARAQVVFTGGISLYYDKSPYATSIYPFPSGVEREHFAPAAEREAFPRPDDIAHIAPPILGYYGVIDERMDLALIRHLAESHPEWNIVLVGPVVKIDPNDVPQLPNVHVTGMKTYDQLPAYLAHFDVALVPFAMNEATRFLSPTKTLEYLAARKPVVSTPIHDVIELYGSVVDVGYSPEEFAQHVENALTSTPSADHYEAVDHLLQEYAWDEIASRMQRIIRRKYQSIHPHSVVTPGVRPLVSAFSQD